MTQQQMLNTIRSFAGDWNTDCGADYAHLAAEMVGYNLPRDVITNILSRAYHAVKGAEE